MPLRLFCRKSLAKYLDPEELFTLTKQGFGFYEQFFAMKYPFHKYDQIFAPEFNQVRRRCEWRGVAGPKGSVVRCPHPPR